MHVVRMSVCKFFLATSKVDNTMSGTAETRTFFPSFGKVGLDTLKLYLTSKVFIVSSIICAMFSVVFEKYTYVSVGMYCTPSGRDKADSVGSKDVYSRCIAQLFPFIGQNIQRGNGGCEIRFKEVQVGCGYIVRQKNNMTTMRRSYLLHSASVPRHISVMVSHHHWCLFSLVHPSPHQEHWGSRHTHVFIRGAVHAKPVGFIPTRCIPGRSFCMKPSMI